MNRADVLNILNQRWPDIQKFDVVYLGLFGSLARNEAGPQSDVDLLVQFAGRATFDQYMSLRLYLEDLLGCRVDLVTRSALRPRLRAQVDAELVRVA